MYQQTSYKPKRLLSVAAVSFMETQFQGLTCQSVTLMAVKGETPYRITGALVRPGYIGNRGYGARRFQAASSLTASD